MVASSFPARKCPSRLFARLFLLGLLFVTGISAHAQLRIDRILADQDGKLVPAEQTLVRQGQHLILVVSGQDSLLKDLSEATIYFNGLAMPCYQPVLNYPPCRDIAAGMSAGMGTASTAATAAAASAAGQAAGADSGKGCFTLNFVLNRDSVNIWDGWYGFNEPSIPVRIGIGTRDKLLSNRIVPVRVRTYYEGVLRTAWFVAAAFLLVSLLMGFVYKTSLLKDQSLIPSTAVKPYSLARFQLYWWTLIVFTSYILLFAIRDHFSLLNPTALILMGISISTTGFSFLIDYSDSNKDRHQNQPTEGFWKDILSDEDGISIHRYQNVIFTFLYGIIFIYKVLNTGHMPEFGQTELFLMGLSSAGYLALKAGENKKAPGVAVDPDASAEDGPPDSFPGNTPANAGGIPNPGSGPGQVNPHAVG